MLLKHSAALQDEVDPHVLLPYRSGEALLLLLLKDRYAASMQAGPKSL